MAEVNESSILDDVKKVLMISPSDTSFDDDVIMGINTAFTSLHDLGVGPEPALEIKDRTAKWSDFMEGTPNMASVKTYVSLSVKQDFDHTGTSYVLTAREKKIEKLGNLLMYAHDKTADRRPKTANFLPGLGG